MKQDGVQDSGWIMSLDSQHYIPGAHYSHCLGASPYYMGRYVSFKVIIHGWLA